MQKRTEFIIVRRLSGGFVRVHQVCTQSNQWQLGSAGQSNFHAGLRTLGSPFWWALESILYPSVRPVIKYLTFGDLRQVEFILIKKGYLKGLWLFILFNFNSNFSLVSSFE